MNAQPNQHNLDRTEATTQWFDERQDEDRYWEEEIFEPLPLQDDGRSDGYGESYSERQV